MDQDFLDIQYHCNISPIIISPVIFEGLHKAAATGHVDVVSSFIKFRPVLINQKLQDKTLLMVAAYQGIKVDHIIFNTVENLDTIKWTPFIRGIYI